jgi:hypothetical protein
MDATRTRVIVILSLSIALAGCGNDGGGGGPVGSPLEWSPPCESGGGGGGGVQEPMFLFNLPSSTGWHGSPVVVDVDHDGDREIIASHGEVVLYDAAGQRLAGAGGELGGRTYTPHIVADLEGDGRIDIVFQKRHEVVAVEFDGGGFVTKPGFPASTLVLDDSHEVRALAAADIDGNGDLEIVAGTTQPRAFDEGGQQVFVFNHDGSHFPGWPRYAESDLMRNGMGHDAGGVYGLGIAIANLDDDPQLEIVVTYLDNQMQVFNHDGEALDASEWFRNPSGMFDGERLTYGQIVRYVDMAEEERWYHFDEGARPPPEAERLQWNVSPPIVADIDRDGVNEIISAPSIEVGTGQTVAYGLFVIEGAQGNGRRAAERSEGWEVIPRGETPFDPGGLIPPVGILAPALGDLSGDDRPEIIVSLNDGFMYAFSADALQLWRVDFRHGRDMMFASEPTLADLNGDGLPEVLFATYGRPESVDAGFLMVVDAGGGVLYDVALPNPGSDGNGNGAVAAPGIVDLEDDGQLEILVQTFDHGVDVFTVPGSGNRCLAWPTARGTPLRAGRAIED